MRATVERGLGSAAWDVEPAPPSRACRLSGSLAGAAARVLEATELPAGRGRSSVFTRLDCRRTGAAIEFEHDLAA